MKTTEHRSISQTRKKMPENVFRCVRVTVCVSEEEKARERERSRMIERER